VKILFLDIETSPNVAHVWGLFKQTVAMNQLMESSYTLCWAAKWSGSEEVLFNSVHHAPARKMVKQVHELLGQADLVVHYHGTSFDIPTLNKEFLLHGLTPPAPYQEVDLLKVVRRQFRFPSNRLDYVCQRLKLGKKFEHEGHELWVKCMNDDPQAWKRMEEYNKHDVVLLEELYHRLLPWIHSHPNRGVYEGTAVCPTCGSAEYQHRGYSYTKLGKFQRYQCLPCRSWFRGAQNLAGKGLMR
jgi:DNA polymerase elongation subunit (family B)